MTLPSRVPPGFTDPPPDAGALTRSLLVAVLAVLVAWALLVALCLLLAHSLAALRFSPLQVPLYLSLWLVLTFLLQAPLRLATPRPRASLVVTAAQEPALFALFAEVAAHVGTRGPDEVVLVPEVTAAVGPVGGPGALLGLGRRRLVVGLGLLNMLTVSQFRAVIGHEFGHFSQGSGVLHHAAYGSSIVMDAILFRRDAFDDVLDRLAERHPWTTRFTNIARATVDGVRRLFAALYGRLLDARGERSQAMEFHADRVAASVAGSDAVVECLDRITLANACLDAALAELKRLAAQGVCTDDVYHHQARLEDTVRRRARRPRWGLLAPGERVSFPAHEAAAPMWASHPSTRDREAALRRVSIDAPRDERPASTLLRDPLSWNRRVSARVTTPLRRPGVRAVDAATVQRRLDADLDAARLPDHYRGAWSHRELTALDVDELAGSIYAERSLHESMRRAAADPYDDALASQVESRWNLVEELMLLVRAGDGAVRTERGGFVFRGRTVYLRDLESLFKAQLDSLGASDRWFEDFDRVFVRAHLAMASAVDRAAMQRLRDALAFQATLARVIDGLYALDDDDRLPARLKALLRPCEETRLADGRDVAQMMDPDRVREGAPVDRRSAVALIAHRASLMRSSNLRAWTSLCDELRSRWLAAGSPAPVTVGIALSAG